MTSSSRWKNVKEIAAAAVKLDLHDRERFLAEACPNTAVREEVESLLSYAAEDFLETPAVAELEERVTRAPGQTLGSYEILATIGAGGMGEVFRARDTTLGRDVAIKILPAELSRVEERLERFEREARLLASLNHPGIATVHGLELSDGVHYIVMELIAGETLEKKIEGGAPPLDEALPLLHQIARALEAAHDKGVIHRDLKPANIMVSAEGNVKILDFGLAKDFSEPTANAEGRTLAKEETREGVILGTVAYMSPEQARGRPVDKRTDLWAFGSVAYEVLAGKPAFPGEAFTDVVASIVHSDPDWNALPAETPTKVRDLLRRCLQRDLPHRMRDIGDARIELEEAMADAPPPPATTAVRRKRGMLPTIVLLTALVSALTAWGVLRRDPSITSEVTRAVIPLGPSAELAFSHGSAIALTPDGRHIAYAVRRDDGSELHLRALEQSESRVVASADGQEVAWMPFFSPDNQWLGFVEEAQLKKVAVSGGAPVGLASVGAVHGASWSAAGMIVLAQDSTFGLSLVSAEGGDIETLTLPDRDARVKAHRFPAFLPSGDAVVFTLATADIQSWDDADIAVMSLETGEYHVVVEGGTNACYSETGHLIYGRGGFLFAVPFDTTALDVTGPPVQVLDGVAMWTSAGNAEFALSRTGTLIYGPGTPGGEERRVVRVARDGRTDALVGEDRGVVHARLSPDGRALALEIGGANHGLWVYDIGRTTMTRLALGFDNVSPVWTPDGKRVAFASNRSGQMNLFWLLADGSEPAKRLTTSEYPQKPGSWSANGKTLIFEQHRPETGWDLWTLSPDDDSGPAPFLQTPYAERRPAFSTDGRVVAYESDETGQTEVYVRSFPISDEKRRVSRGGGRFPSWSLDGELFYRHRGRVLVVEMGDLENPRPLFERPSASGAFDVAADRESVIMVDDAESARAPTQLNLVLHWSHALERLMTR